MPFSSYCEPRSTSGDPSFRFFDPVSCQACVLILSPCSFSRVRSQRQIRTGKRRTSSPHIFSSPFSSSCFPVSRSLLPTMHPLLRQTLFLLFFEKIQSSSLVHVKVLAFPLTLSLLSVFKIIQKAFLLMISFPASLLLWLSACPLFPPPISRHRDHDSGRLWDQ